MSIFPVIIGPTAGGKSAIAMALARALVNTRTGAGRRAELISADAFQIYHGMDLGTAKPSPADRAAVPHHLIDIRDPTEPFSVDDWLHLAEPLIDAVRVRDALPIVIGGTHLYIKALLEGLFDGPPPDETLRSALAARATNDLHEELARLDPAAAQRIHRNDRRRTIRALEVFHQTGSPISELQRQWDRTRRPDAQLVILNWPTELINQRINARLRAMLDAGLVDEARGLWERGQLGPQAREALGYKQLIAHFEGRCALDEAVERIKIDTRRFAKNQRTWIRRLSAAPPGAPTPIIVRGAEQTPNQIVQIILSQ